MDIKPAHWSDLPKGDEYQPIYRLARIAVGDTIMGGCSALTIAKRAQAMGLPRAGEMLAAVGDVYASSTGKAPGHLHPWQCTECGRVYALEDEAIDCCNFQE